MRCPNWPPWEEPVEEKPDAHKARPVAQGFSQTSSVDTHVKVACVAANLGHTQAHWEAVERTLHLSLAHPTHRPHTSRQAAHRRATQTQIQTATWPSTGVPYWETCPSLTAAPSLVLGAARHRPLRVTHHRERLHRSNAQRQGGIVASQPRPRH